MKRSVRSLLASNRKLVLLSLVIASIAVSLIDWNAKADVLGEPLPAGFFAYDTGGNVLYDLIPANPVTVQSSLPVTGLLAGEKVVGIDIRPATGELYGVGTTGSLSRVLKFNTTTGAATAVGSGFTPVLPTTSFYGVDFDPQTDRIRVVSFNDNNLLLNPDTGGLVSLDTNLAFAPGDPNFGDNPAVDLLGFSTFFPPSPQVTCFAIDTSNAALVRIGGVNGSPPASNGQLTTIGSLGIGSLFQSGGFDIDLDGDAFVTLNNKLYGVNLTTGQASFVGNLTVPVGGIAIKSRNRVLPPPFIVTGPKIGPEFRVRLFDLPTDRLVLQNSPFGTSFTGGIRVALGDVNGDGTPDIAAGTATGDSRVKVFNGLTGELLRDFQAIPGFTGGISVAVGDTNGDGPADIVVGAGPGGGPEVKVFSGANNSLLQDFFAYAPTFTGGIHVATFDIDGDGKADIVTGPGAGGGPNVKVFDGTNPGNVLQSFFAYPPTFLGGVRVAGGDVNGNGTSDIITGAGPGGGPHVKVFDGNNPGAEIRNFFAYDPTFTGGVDVAGGDVNGDGSADIITGPGDFPPPQRDGLEFIEGTIPPPGPQVRVFSGATGQQINSFFAYDTSFQGGVVVAVAGTATAGTPTPTATPTNTPTATPTATPINPPSAAAVAANVTTPGAFNLTITTTYTDNTGINVSTLSGGDHNITGPNAFGATAPFVGVDINTNGTPRVATYFLIPPGGSWDAGDNGVYTINMQAGEVADIDGNFVPVGPVGTFSVNIGGTPTPTNTPTATPTVTPTPGFEGDVAPRPNGDAIVIATDVTQLRRFATGLDTPGVGTNEGQRADIAPRATFGDGIINSGDVIQGRRYATGLDPLTGAGGPTVTAPPAEGLMAIIEDVYAYFFGREIRVGSMKAESGSTVTVPVEIKPYGDETAASFTLEYDAKMLSNPRVSLGEAAPENAVLTVNANEDGRIGILVDSTERMMASAMPQRFVTIMFDVAPDAAGETPVVMTSSLAAKGTSDGDGRTLTVSYINGSVLITRDTK